MPQNLAGHIFSVDDSSFEATAMQIYLHQYERVGVYRDFCDRLKRQPSQVHRLIDIPFLPVHFFKSYDVIEQGLNSQKTFESSTTTGSIPSRHMVADLGIYEHSFLQAFELFYGDPKGYCFLALLPSYIERGTSSLLYMADHLIRLSGHPQSGFINRDFEDLNKRIQVAKKTGSKLFLLGVTYALLDFAELYPMDLSGSVIMETGGMKGRREELTREEIHSSLNTAFHTAAIHSEYGMTELLSQAYSKGEGLFHCPPWMRISARDPYDPMAYVEPGRTGTLNIIDLANLHSCSFLAVSDLGRVHKDGSFEVLGRADNTEIRGCNLMYEM